MASPKSGIVPVTSRYEAMKQVETSLRALDEERKEIARVYAGAPSHSAIENALGESLTFVRKAIEKLTKARNELMQTELDM